MEDEKNIVYSSEETKTETPMQRAFREAQEKKEKEENK